MEDSLKKRYLIKLFSNIVNGLMNVILVATVPKALGPVAFGQFNYLQQFFSQMIGFLDSGTSMAFFTKLSAKTNRRELLTFYALFSIFILFMIFLIIYLILFCDCLNIVLPDIPIKYLYFGLWFGFMTWLTQIYIKISDAFALTISVEIVKVFHKMTFMLLLLWMVSCITFDLSIYFYFNYMSLASFLLIISILFVQKNIFTKSLFTLKFNYKIIILEFIHFCSPLVIFNIIGVSAGLFDIWLLQKLGGSIQSGFYGLSYSIASMCFLFTSAMTPIITREFSRYNENKDMENIQKLFYRYIPMMYSIAAYFSVFVAFQSKNLIEIFTDEKFKAAYLVLTVMAFYPIHQTYGQLSGSLFFATNKTKLYKNIGIVTSIISFMLTLVFLYFLELQALGLAWKMVIAQIIGVNIQLYFNCKFFNTSMQYFIRHQIYSVLIFTLCAFIGKNIFFWVDNLVIEFILSGTVYTLLVIIVSLIFPHIFAISRDEIKKVLHLKKVDKI